MIYKKLEQNTIMRIILLLFAFFIFIPLVLAMANPSVVYCESLGYTYYTKTTELGDVGYCKLPNGNEVNAWDFYMGKVAQEYTYCSKMGYEIKTDEYGVYCILLNGTEIDEKILMDLNLEETTCGDGTCGIPENYETCPQDCPSGSFDEYCDGIEDDICDPDCTPESDIDCQTTAPPTTIEKTVLTTRQTTSITQSGPVCGNGRCESGEEGTCPQDCPKEFPTVIISIIILVIIIVVMIFIESKKKQKEEEYVNSFFYR